MLTEIFRELWRQPFGRMAAPPCGRTLVGAPAASFSYMLVSLATARDSW